MLSIKSPDHSKRHMVRNLIASQCTKAESKRQREKRNMRKKELTEKIDEIILEIGACDAEISRKEKDLEDAFQKLDGINFRTALEIQGEVHELKAERRIKQHELTQLEKEK